MEESRLVERMKDGDRSAFNLLYEQYCNPLLRMALLLLGNQADAEDVVQETFIKCFLHCKSLKDNHTFKSWLYTILTRTAWQYNKNHRCEFPCEVSELAGEPDTIQSNLDMVLAKEQTKAICQMIQKLDMKHRTVIIYYYYNQMSTKEIAGICGCLEGTVKSRLFHARKLLKEEIMKWKQEEKAYERPSKYRKYVNKSNAGLH